MRKFENQTDCFNESKKTIDRFLKKKILPHAILVEGSDEGLRSELINYIANAMVCEGILKPCGECRHCKKAQSKIHPDIECIQTSGTSKSFNVDTVRRIRESANVLPNEAQRKVYVLNGADQMSISAQNSLLKILEEPPRSATFILGVKSEQSLLPTVRSRVMIFKTGGSKVFSSDDELTELTDEVSGALFCTKEFEIVKATAHLSKDKQLLKEVFDQLIVDLKSAYTNIIFGNAESDFSRKLRIDQIIKIIDKLNEGIQLIERNVNVSLIITVTFFKIRQIIFS